MPAVCPSPLGLTERSRWGCGGRQPWEPCDIATRAGTSQSSHCMRHKTQTATLAVAPFVLETPELPDISTAEGASEWRETLSGAPPSRDRTTLHNSGWVLGGAQGDTVSRSLE